MHLLKTNFNGNPNIGLCCTATDEYCIVGAGLNKDLIEKIKEVLNVPIIEMTMCGTNLIGVFCAANSNKLLVPEIVFDEELKILEENKINYEVIKTKHTALGNNILCNDQGCLVSRDFSDAVVKKIEDSLGVKAIKKTINGFDIVGSLAVINGNHCLIHEDVNKEDVDLIENIFNVKCGTGTVNMGNPYIKSGVVVNKNGFIIGGLSGGPEIANADEVLGFLE